MIPAITEIHFPSYITLHQATVSFEEMGERTIATQVRIDGDIAPEFGVWEEENGVSVFKPMELEFRGERFVLPTLKPQAAKDNSSRNSLVDLVFISAPIAELKRYFFAEMTEIEVGTIIIDKYVASLRLSLKDFVAAFNRVLSYYFPDGSFVMNLNPSYADSGEVKDFPIDYMYIWDVLAKLNEIYGVTWRAVTTVQNDQRVTVIRVGYDAGSIDNHIFEYGFNGGLLRFERHVEDSDIYNVLLGRGGEKNIPYRYYKDIDPFNTAWTADPDAIPELSTVYFPRLLDANFRRYVQGWKAKHYGDTYDSTRAETDWAYQKGYTDTKFDPVEYVKDDDSIAIYGVRQGKLDDNDDIYPTIQGVWLDGLGRADEVVDVYVTSEDSQEAIYDQKTDLNDVLLSVNEEYAWVNKIVRSDYTFSVPAGRVGNIEYAWLQEPLTPRGENPTGKLDTANCVISTGNPPIPSDDSGYERLGEISGLSPGSYYLHVMMRIERKDGYSTIQGKFGLGSLSLHCTPKDKISYRQVFTIWVKNIWETTQNDGESDADYAHRVWDHILGDKLGQSAAVHFSSGFMSVSEDYEFLIQKLPEVDRTKTITTEDENGNAITVSSEWKITLVRSDAEYEATGLYIPNTETGGLPIAGDFFFFTGIDLPFQYVKWAEERLTKSKEDALRENAWTNPTWIINLDKVRAHTLKEEDYGELLSDRLDAGVLVNISDPRFTLDNDRRQTTLTLGIRTVTFNWNEPSEGNPYLVPDIEIVLSDKIVYQRDYSSVKGDVTYIQQNYTTVNQAKNIAKKTKSSTVEGVAGVQTGAVIGTVEE